MKRSQCLLLILTLSYILSGAESVTLPAWLTPFPGADPALSGSAAQVESTYKVTAKASDVIAHYQHEFEAAGLAFVPNFDGTGTSIRGSAPECSLVIQVREQDDSTAVHISCALRPADTASSDAGVPLNGSSVPRYGSPGRYGVRDPHAVDMRAEAEARHQARVSQMSRFDQPVYPHDPVGIALKWPAWLVHMRGADRDLEVAHAVDQSGLKNLTSKFSTSVPMTAIHRYYGELLESHGFSVGQSKLETGTTFSGVSQNRDGYVIGTYQPNGIGAGGTEIKVSFSRWELNAPIKVELTVKLIRTLR